MIARRALILISSIFLFWEIRLFATIDGGLEPGIMRSLVPIFLIAQAERDGEVPESWSDLIHLDEDMLRYPLTDDGANVTDLYSFIHPWQAAEFDGGHIILVRYLPRSDSRVTRLMLYRDERGHIWLRGLVEERFQAVLAANGIQVPPPQPLPPKSLRPAGNDQQQSVLDGAGEGQVKTPDAMRDAEPPPGDPEGTAAKGLVPETRGTLFWWLISFVLGTLLLWFGWRRQKGKGFRASDS